jgi:drug/metabolite transporter (DMT)-like permease
MTIEPWMWVVFTVIAAGSQTLRNAMQKELTRTIGTAGATHVRFLFGLPFAMLSLAVTLWVTGHVLPRMDTSVVLWSLLGALTQIAATALMLAAMQERSFVVTTALIKIEPVWVALFGLVFLGDHLSWALAAAILIATTGVMLVSWPKSVETYAKSDGRQVKKSTEPGLWEGQITSRGEAMRYWVPASTVELPRKAEAWLGMAAVYGILAGMMFGVSAVGYRGGILGVKALGEDHFVVAATSVLVLGLVMQVVLLSAYLILFDRKTLAGIFAAWRPSILAGFMGALASQFWFLAFSVDTAARVRTLAIIEIFFAQLVSRSMFKQGLSWREGLGILLIVAGVVWLLSGT